MKTEEKIKAILDAVNAGTPKRQLELPSNGRTIRQMLRGERVTERKVEEIYANLQAYQSNQEEAKRKRANYHEMYPEVAKETKISAVLGAVASGRCAKCRLDPAGTGNAIRDLQQGLGVGICKLNEMYDNLLKMSGKAPKRRAKTKAERPEKKGNGGPDLERKVQEQEKQLAYLLDKVAGLEAKIGELSVALEQANLPQKIAGMTVVQKTDVIGGRAYARWYGMCRHQGKQRWIYIGKDKKRAAEKIEQWIAKNKWTGQ